MNAPTPGTVFTHQRYLDANRQPAEMKVTSVRRDTVYFTYADSPTNKGAFYLPLATWIAQYGSGNNGDKGGNGTIAVRDYVLSLI